MHTIKVIVGILGIFVPSLLMAGGYGEPIIDLETEVSVDTGYINYSSLSPGFSPVVGIKFGNLKGLNLGMGYGINNIFKPYVGASANSDEEYLTDVAVGVFVGVNSALMFDGLVLDVGVELVSEDNLVSYAAFGWRW